MNPKLRPWLTGGGVVLVILALLVGALFAFKDEILRARFESRLEDIDGLGASVGDAQLELNGGRLVFEDIVLEQRDAAALDEPLATIDRVELQIHGGLLDSDSRATLHVSGAELRLVRGPERGLSFAGLGSRAREEGRGLSRWSLDAIYIDDSTITYRDPSYDLSLELTQLDADIENLAAARRAREQARFSLTGELEGAELELRGSTQVGVEQPTFDLRGSIVGMPLMKLSGLARRRADLVIQDGYATLGVDAQGEDGELSGYFAPHLSQLELEGAGELVDGLKSFVGEVAAEQIDDPFFGNSRLLEFVGSYGGGEGVQLRALDEDNSWLQEKLLARIG